MCSHTRHSVLAGYTGIMNIQLNLIDEICPRCSKPSSEVGELHEDDQLCANCEKEFVAETLDFINDMFNPIVPDK